MRNTRGTLASLAAMAAMAFSGAASANMDVPTTPKARLSSSVLPFKTLREMFRGKETTRLYGAARRGPGWSHAQVQRMARKKKNQSRNRRAHRG